MEWRLLLQWLLKSTLGVKSFEEVSIENISEQIDCVFEDIIPDAVKTGMLASQSI